MQKILHKKAIALLITVFFIMLITLSVGVGLNYINEGKRSIASEQLMFQSAMIIHDVLDILKTSPELEQINSAQAMSNFLLSSEVIPFESQGVQVLIKISSARSKINPNALKEKRVLDRFKDFLTIRGLNPSYADILFDSTSGIKVDQSYTTDIFNKNPILFRDYIASQKHLEEINTFYINYFHDVNLKNLKMQEIFYPSKDINSSIDLNYATPLVYELILGCDTMRAEALSLDENIFETLEDLQLSDEEKINIVKFKTSFFEPYLDVKVQITQKNTISNIRFEYNIKSKKGSNFVFEV